MDYKDVVIKQLIELTTQNIMIAEKLCNLQGQVDSLQDCFKKKLLETQEPLSEDWARAELDQLHANLRTMVGLHNGAITRIEKLEYEHNKLTQLVNEVVHG